MVIEKITVTKTFTEEEKTQIAEVLIEIIQKKQAPTHWQCKK